MAERTVTVRLRAATDQFRQEFRKSSQQVSSFAKDNQEHLRKVGMAMVAFGATSGLVLTRLGNEAIAAESTFAKLETQIGLTRDEALSMREGVEAIRDTGQGLNELGEAAFFAASAGQRGAAAIDTVERAAKAADVGLGSTKEIVDLVTSATNAYGEANVDAAEATDVLVGAVREGKVEASQLAGAMGQVLPVASEMGADFDEVGAAIAAMTRTGTDAGTATRQLRQILASLLKPAEQTRTQLDELGLSVEGVRASIQEDGLWKALRDLSDAAGGNQDALGKLFPDVEALSGFLDLTGKNAEQTAATFDALADSTGNLDDAHARYSETVQAAQERTSAAWERARTQLGEATLSMRQNLAVLSETAANALEDMDESSRQTVVHLGAAATGVSTLGGAALIAGPRIMETTQALGGLRNVMARGLAVGAVTFAVFELVEGFKRGRLEADRMMQEIIDGSASAEEAIGKLDDTLQEHLDSLGEFDASTLGNALLGFVGAARQAGDVVGDMRKAWRLWRGESEVAAEFAEDHGAALAVQRGEVESLTGAVLGLSGATSGQVGPTREAAEAHDDAGRAAGGASDSLETLSERAEGWNKAAGRLSDTVQALAGVHIDAERAALDFADSLDDLEGEGDDWAATLDANTKAGRDNRRSLLDSAEAALSHGEALREEGASADEAANAVRDHLEALIDQAVEAGHSRQAVEDLLAEMNLMPDEVSTAIRIDNEQALAALQEVQAGMQRISGGVVAEVGVRTAGGANATVRHAGGAVGTAGPMRRLHAGGAATQATPSAGLADNERLAVLEKSEHVLTGQQMSVLQGLFGGQRGQAMQPTEQHVDRSVNIENQWVSDWQNAKQQLQKEQAIASLKGRGFGNRG